MHSSLVAHSDTNWATPECIIADTTAPTGDRVYVVGEELYALTPADVIMDCRGPMAFAARPLEVEASIPPRTVDLRELIDALPGPAGRNRPDVIVTRNPIVIAYAATRSDFLVKPLPWDITYVVVTATRPTAQTGPSLAERTAIARDAVTADVRSATEPFAWRSDSICANSRMTTSQTFNSNAPPIIAFSSDDIIARQLAERMVSLLTTNTRTSWIASEFGQHRPVSGFRIAPFPADSLDTILATGRAIAAVRPVARDPRTPCGTRTNAPVPLGAIPLVDSRAHVLVRRGSGAMFYVAPDGSLQFFRRPRP